MEAFIEKFRYKATKSKQVQDRVKKLEKIKRIELPEEKKTVKFNFKQPPRTGDEVVRARGLVKRYGDKAVYDASTSPCTAATRSRSWAPTARARQRCSTA